MFRLLISCVVSLFGRFFGSNESKKHVQVPDFLLPNSKEEYLYQVDGLLQCIQRQQQSYNAKQQNIVNLLGELDRQPDSVKKVREKKRLQAELAMLCHPPKLDDQELDFIASNIRKIENDTIFRNGQCLHETPVDGSSNRGRGGFNQVRRIVIFEGKWFLCIVDKTKNNKDESCVCWVSSSYDDLLEDELAVLESKGF